MRRTFERGNEGAAFDRAHQGVSPDVPVDAVGLPVRGVKGEVGMVWEMVGNVERRAERAQGDEEPRSPLARPLPARRKSACIRRKGRSDYRNGNILAANDQTYALTQDVRDGLRLERRSTADGRERKATESVVCA